MRQSFQNKFIESAAGYGIAAGCVTAALSLTLLLWNWIEPQATPLFLAAVAVTAWRCGKYPSLFATFLAVLSIDYFFNPPLFTFEISVDNAASAAVFTAAALLISWIDGERKNALRERDRLLTSEREARRAAEEANRAKDTFLAMVTHELRAPLNTILGWTNLLGKGTLDAEKTRHAVAVIARGRRRNLSKICWTFRASGRENFTSTRVQSNFAPSLTGRLNRSRRQSPLKESVCTAI